MYTIYGTLRSRAFRPMWTLEELGQPYSLVEATPQSDIVRNVSALGKIPVLDVDGTLVSDSVAIMTYLADRHAALTFPSGTLERAHQDATTFRWLDEVDSLLWSAARHVRVLPDAQRCAAVLPSIQWELDRNLTRIEEEFSTEFIAGDVFTIADILATHCLNWAHSVDLPTGGEKLTAYTKRMRARPAFQKLFKR